MVTLEIIGFIIISILFLILIKQFILAITAITNHKKHGTYDKEPHPRYKCTKCKRPLVMKTNGNFYCAWCDIEYKNM